MQKYRATAVVYKPRHTKEEDLPRYSSSVELTVVNKLLVQL